MQRVPAILILASLIAGCEGTPSDLRPWRAEDHDHNDTPNAAQVEGTAPTQGPDQVAVAAWRRSCARCHGMMGKGDGPDGRMLHARDLTSREWQSSVTDQQIAQVIRQGRGEMPAFDLPESTVAGLVELVRMMGGRSAHSAPRRDPGDAGARADDAGASKPARSDAAADDTAKP